MSDDDDTIAPKSLVCVLWIFKTGQRKPVASFSLVPANLFGMTYPQAVTFFDKKVSLNCSTKYTSDSAISFRATTCKLASKAHDPPKGFPDFVEFSEWNSEEAYDTFLQFVRANLVQMKKGQELIIRVIALLAPKPAAAVGDQGMVDLDANQSDASTNGEVARKVFPF